MKRKQATWKETLSLLVRRLGGRYSSDLGIAVSSGRSSEIFKWFLASKLFGGRISEKIAARTYRRFESHRVLSADAIIKTGWDGLVEILDEGGYVRYDFSTATKLLLIMRDLLDRWKGNLNKLHKASKDARDLEIKLQSLGKGIGPVTCSIFLRELRGIWEKANPAISERAVIAARCLGILPKRLKDPERVRRSLQSLWRKEPLSVCDFAEFESALVRLGKNYCRKARCNLCPVTEICPHAEMKARQRKHTPAT